MKISLAIVGSRSFNDYKLLCGVLKILQKKYDITRIVSGGAQGADSLGEKYGKENNIETLIFRAEWDKYGKAAGFIRNKTIVDNCDVVLALWDGKSKGTQHTINIAKEKNKKVYIKEFECT